MKSHRRITRRLHRLAIGLAVIGALVPASAASASGAPAHQDGAYLRPIPSLTAKQYADAYNAAFDSSAQVGDKPSDYPGAGRVPDPPTVAHVGDTPADYPGASGSPDAATPIVLVRPERTIVHGANQALPIALSIIALAISLMSAAFLLVRAVVQRRHTVRAAH